MALLVVTGEFDPHADVVLGHLQCPRIRLDVEDLIRGAAAVEWSGGSWCVTTPHHRVVASEITAVWWRKPLIRPEALPSGDREVAVLWGFMLDNLAALLADRGWVNPPEKFWRASKKLYQLDVANRLGLRSPRTMFSTTPGGECAAFFDGLKVIWKSIVTQHSLQGVHIEPSFGNVLLTAADFQDSAALPSLLQEFHRRRREIRVTVVGQEVFSAAQTSDSSYIDIKECTTIQVVRQEIPAEIENKLRGFMDATGLDYCAFDFIEDEAGELLFLEANPNGQWLWIEVQTGLPISSAVARLLESKVRQPPEPPLASFSS